MELIIKNMFLTTSGKLIGKRDITITDTTTASLYDPPLYYSPLDGKCPACRWQLIFSA